MDLERLKEWATPRQSEIIDAIITHGTQAQAAKALGIKRQSVQYSMKGLRKRAARQGYAPEHDMVHTSPSTHIVKGASTLYDADGNVKLQWTKTTLAEERLEDALKAFEETISNACETLPVIPPIKPPVFNDSSLCTVYTITDFHLGMLAWEREGGANWDLSIAEDTLINAFSDLMNSSPDSEVAVFNQLGDFLHFDGHEAVTPSHGHVLDASDRFQKVVELALNVTIKVVGMLLSKHKRVKVIMCEGNHDLASSVWLRSSLSQIFSSNDRVDVDTSALPFYAHVHGDILLGFHHGHKVKNKSLPQLFASEPSFRKLWGDAKYTYIHTGHYHHQEQEISEGGGAIVERHPTLSARDAYSSRGGYVSWRCAKAITYHKTTGEKARASTVPS